MILGQILHKTGEGSVHKYFGGGLGNWKFLSSNFFDPPSQAAKTVWTPLNKCKNFFDPQCLSSTPIYLVCTTGVPVLLVTLNYSAKPFFMDKPVARFFNYSCKGLNLEDL